MYSDMTYIQLRDECRRSGAPEAFVSESGREDMERFLTRVRTLAAFGLRPDAKAEVLAVLRDRARMEEAAVDAEVTGMPESPEDIAAFCLKWGMPESVVGKGKAAIMKYVEKCHALAMSGVTPGDADQYSPEGIARSIEKEMEEEHMQTRVKKAVSESRPDESESGPGESDSGTFVSYFQETTSHPFGGG